MDCRVDDGGGCSRILSVGIQQCVVPGGIKNLNSFAKFGWCMLVNFGYVFDDLRHLQRWDIFQRLDIHSSNVGTSCQINVAGLEIPSFDINKCYKQGSIEGPKIWKVIMVHLVSLLLPIWYEQELGFVVDSQVDKFGNVTEIRKVISHFIWADNLWIVADSIF